MTFLSLGILYPLFNILRVLTGWIDGPVQRSSPLGPSWVFRGTLPLYLHPTVLLILSVWSLTFYFPMCPSFEVVRYLSGETQKSMKSSQVYSLLCWVLVPFLFLIPPLRTSSVFRRLPRTKVVGLTFWSSKYSVTHSLGFPKMD